MTKPQSKTSMVIPCYNKEESISRMFDSILAQEWDNIELILVNDGSTDGTRGIITEYEPKFLERGYEVVIIDQDNQDVAAAVRNGLLRVTGEYVCQVDADDELDPRYVSMMAGWLDEHLWYEWAAKFEALDVKRKPVYDMVGSIMKGYHVNVFYSEDDNGYIADIPDLIFCSAFGDTPEQALSEALTAKSAWLTSAYANSIPIPAPLYRPEIY